MILNGNCSKPFFRMGLHYSCSILCYSYSIMHTFISWKSTCALKTMLWKNVLLCFKCPWSSGIKDIFKFVSSCEEYWKGVLKYSEWSSLVKPFMLQGMVTAVCNANSVVLWIPCELELKWRYLFKITYCYVTCMNTVTYLSTSPFWT